MKLFSVNGEGMQGDVIFLMFRCSDDARKNEIKCKFFE